VLLEGRWKGIRSESRAAPLELYDLRADTAEAHDVASEHPEIVGKIETYLKTAREDSANWPMRDAPTAKSIPGK
jgi:arylsulfatase A-like enzyme